MYASQLTDINRIKLNKIWLLYIVYIYEIKDATVVIILILARTTYTVHFGPRYHLHLLIDHISLITIPQTKSMQFIKNQNINLIKSNQIIHKTQGTLKHHKHRPFQNCSNCLNMYILPYLITHHFGNSLHKHLHVLVQN